MKKLLILVMLLLSIASFGQESLVKKETKMEKLILKNFKEDQLSLSDIVALTSYVGTLSEKKGVLYIIANANEKDSYKENEKLCQERIAFVSSVIDMNANVKKKGIEYKKISLSNTQAFFDRSNLAPIQLLFIEETL